LHIVIRLSGGCTASIVDADPTEVFVFPKNIQHVIAKKNGDKFLHPKFLPNVLSKETCELLVKTFETNTFDDLKELSQYLKPEEQHILQDYNFAKIRLLDDPNWTKEFHIDTASHKTVQI